MIEFNLFTGFTYANSNVGDQVSRIQTYIDQKISGEVQTNRLPVDNEDELRVESGVAEVLLSPENNSHVFPYDESMLTMSIGLDELRRDGGDERLTEFIDLVTLVYDATDPQYGFGMLSYRLEAIDVELPPPISDTGLSDGRIDHPTWLMLMPPAMVKTYGREWVETLPAERVDPLTDGGVRIITTTDVTDSTAVHESMQAIEHVFENYQ